MSLAVARPVLSSLPALSLVSQARSALVKPTRHSSHEATDQLKTQVSRGLMPAKDIQFSAPLDPHQPPRFVQGEVLVSFTDDAMPIEILNSFEALNCGLKIQRQIQVPNKESEVPDRLKRLYNLTYNTSTMDMEQVLSILNANPNIHFAEPNYIIQLEGQKSSTAAPKSASDLNADLWGLHNTGQNQGKADADIDAPEAWALPNHANYKPVIAIIDTGVDYTHPELKNQMWRNPGEIEGDGIDNDNNGYIDDVYGWDFANDDNGPMDGNSHGTHVAGTIAAENNGQGIVGVTQNAQIMALKFLTDEGSGTTEDAVEAILYAKAMGVDLSNNSWGGGGYSQALHDAIANGPLFIAAAGNNNKDNDADPHYPAGYDLPNVISVAASDRLDQKASFSNFGKNSVDLAAPGHEIVSSVPGNKYDSYSGTSMATPHVAGVAGLILSHYPQSTLAQVKDRLLNNLDHLPAFKNLSRTEGRLNAFKALENDTLAPAAVTALQVTQSSPTSISLAWQATGDDGLAGQSTRYEVRYSKQPLTEGNWDLARSATAGKPLASGQMDAVKIQNLTPFAQHSRYYVGVRAVDNVGNRSAISQVMGVTPAAHILLQDLAESPHQGLTAEAPWGYDVSQRGQIWSDSPKTHYGNNTNAALLSREVDLTHETGVKLSFQQRFDLENDYDFGLIEVSENEGLTWQEIKHVTGKSQWQGETIDLDSFSGKKIQLRFRLLSDQTVTKAGWDLDDITLYNQKHSID